jgi:hypothetical protein
MKSFRSWLLLGLLLTGAGWFALGYWFGTNASSLKYLNTADVAASSGDRAGGNHEVVPGVNPVAQYESEEGRLASVTLAEENELLRERVVALDEQVHELMLATASERFEADLLRVGPQRDDEVGLDLGKPRGLPPSGSLRVLQVDERYKLVAIEGGHASGLVPDMRFHVVRDDRRVATVKVVEVRDHLAAAVTEGTGSSFPVPGDRLLPVTPTN